MLTAHIAMHTDRRAQQHWLFTEDPGYPPHQNTVAYWWRKTRTAAGVGDLRLHDLRPGCDVVTVRRARGRGSATTTLRTYAHLWPTVEDRTRTAAADLMRSADVKETRADFVRTRGPV